MYRRILACFALEMRCDVAEMRLLCDLVGQRSGMR
jgi:hypothetical protein